MTARRTIPSGAGRRLRRGLLAALLGLGLVLAQPIGAQVTLNLNNADISALIASVSEITGRNFIVDPRVKARVTVVSSQPMAEDEIYEVFLSILAVHGFAAIPDGNVTKIVPEVNAKQDDIPTIELPSPEAGAQVVTAVIQVQNVSAAQVVPILRPLIPPQGHLAAYAPTNVLIISDRAGNVERIAKIIDQVDRASDEEVEIIPLRHASAAEVVRLLNSLEQGRSRNDPAAASQVARMVADERTNSILLSSDPDSRLRLRTLIAHLDTPLESGGNTQVIYLRYAKAEDLVPVLQGVSKNLTEQEQTGGTPQAQPGRTGGSLIDIQAETATNSLVITAPPDALRSLKSVIAQLDIRRAQVLVEAVIAEITTNQAAELGIQWVVDASRAGTGAAATNFTNGSVNLGTVAGAINSDSLPTSLPSGVIGLVGDLEGNVRFGALLSALAADTDNNILSTPTLVTLDNEEAEIVVGQNVPFVTGSFTTDGNNSDNPFQTIQRQDVGLTLKIKPQINEGNAVKLEISQEVSSLASAPGVSASDLITNKRSIKTTVLVEDGQILVLGGLIDDQLDESIQKVPGLGDVPVLGNLFRYRRTSKVKRNLMVFLHPVILRDSLEGSLYTNDKYSYIRAEQLRARQRGVALLPDAETPLLVPPKQVKQSGTILGTDPSLDQPVAVPVAVPPRPEPEPEPLFQQGFNNK